MLNVIGAAWPVKPAKPLAMQWWKVIDVAEPYKNWHFTRFLALNIHVAGCLFLYLVIGDPCLACKLS